MPESAGTRRALDEGYEPEDVHVRAILLVAAGSVVLLALIGGALWLLVGLFAPHQSQPGPTGFEQTLIEMPPPRLQAAPERDLAQFRAREEETLHRTAWVDREAGVAQVPIEKAMHLLATRGWPQPDRPADPVPPRAEQAPPAASQHPLQPGTPESPRVGRPPSEPQGRAR